MGPPYSASCVTLGQLLGGDIRLKVPGYQRAYAWTSDEAGRLLDDVIAAIDEAGEQGHFLGAVVLMETARLERPRRRIGSSARAAEPPVLEIVDGLQRLITLTILLAVLRDIAEGEDEATAQLAQGLIAESGADPAEGAEHLPKVTLAGSSDAFLRRFVQARRATLEMPEDDDLAPPERRLLAVREHLSRSLVEETAARRRQIARFLAEHCHLAVITARTLDRAHQVFASLNDRGQPLARGDILKAQILGSASAGRRKAIEATWAEIEAGLGGSLEELFSHLRTIEGRSRVRIIDEIRELIARSGNAEAFVGSTLAPYALILARIRSASEVLPNPIAGPLSYLGWLGSQDWVPPLMLYWRAVDGDPARLGPFIERLDRLAYGLRILGVGSDKRSVRYRAVIEAIRDGRIEAPSSPIELGRDEQRLIAYNLRTLHARSQLTCKLVLLRLNDLLAGAAQGLDASELTVEHILPQRPARTSQWRSWFPNAEERERCTQSLGNLILVARDTNEQARNLELARKLAIYFADGAEQPHITREIAGLERWGPEEVAEREERLLSVLNRLWRLGTGRNGERPAAQVEGPHTAAASPERA